MQPLFEIINSIFQFVKYDIIVFAIYSKSFSSYKYIYLKIHFTYIVNICSTNFHIFNQTFISGNYNLSMK